MQVRIHIGQATVHRKTNGHMTHTIVLVCFDPETVFVAHTSECFHLFCVLAIISRNELKFLSEALSEALSQHTPRTAAFGSASNKPISHKRMKIFSVPRDPLSQW